MGIEIGSANWVNEANQVSKTACFVFFYDKEEPDNERSLREGRACFKMKTFIKKQVPGDNLVSIDRPVRDQDKLEFAQEWQKYLDKRPEQVDGTPIEQWPVLNRAQVAEFKALNIHSVEQFVQMPESHGAKIMGFNALKAKAKEFLTMAEEAGKAKELRAELNQKDEQIADLSSKLAALASQVEALSKPKRGRPRKVHDVANAA
jgi:hypothetical protein